MMDKVSCAPTVHDNSGRALEWHRTDGELQARYLDAKKGRILAAFMFCRSGYEHLVSRTEGGRVHCNDVTFDTFSEAWRRY